MKFPNPIPIKELAVKLNAEIMGDSTLKVLGINEIHQVKEGDITFSDVKKYFDKALKSAATFIILNEKVELFVKNLFTQLNCNICRVINK